MTSSSFWTTSILTLLHRSSHLGSSIRGAGFTGSNIHMTVCNGGTDPPGQPGGSIAQSVATATDATTVACVGDSMYDHPTIPGVTIAGPAGSMPPFTRRPSHRGLMPPVCASLSTPLSSPREDLVFCAAFALAWEKLRARFGPIRRWPTR